MLETLLNPDAIVATLGLAGIFAIIFLESGVFFAFFLPGDSLLFSAGFLASQGHLDIVSLVIGVFISSFLGVVVGYVFGKRIGENIFQKKDSFFFNPKNLERTKEFYKKYGTWTIMFSRFVPIVRTFAPILGGVGEMKWKTLLQYNFLGSTLWAFLIPMAGYFFGKQIPSLHDLVIPVMTGMFFLTLIPIFIAIYKYSKNKRQKKSV